MNTFYNQKVSTKKKQLKEAYTQCLAAHAAGADACTPAAKAYLECRMERNLMARQDIAELGLDDDDDDEEGGGGGGEGSGKMKGEAAGRPGEENKQQQQQPRTKAGFVAGLRPSAKK